MADSKGSNIRNFMCSSKHALRPPKSPFPSVSPSYTEFVPNSVIGSKAIQKPREGNSHHLRTSSESLLVEEQPAWLDDLLNDPETPVRRAGHRRSSSDSFTYVDVANVSNNVNYTALDDYRYKNLVSSPWGSQDFDYHHKDFRHTPFYPEVNLAKPQQNNRPWESAAKPMTHPSGLVFSKDNNVFQNSGKLGGSRELEGAPPIETEKQNRTEFDFHDSKALSEKDGSHANLSTSETDTKRAKQQFAQRSRVRKLQYIAELEQNVQTLQAEGSEVSAELEFLNQRNLILSMENKALKQRLDNLAQEQLIKYLEQDVLEREIGRLRGLYQQQQQPPQQQPSSSHRRSTSRDIDSQFANLSLKQKDANNSGREPVSGPLRT